MSELTNTELLERAREQIVNWEGTLRATILRDLVVNGELDQLYRAVLDAESASGQVREREAVSDCE